MIHTIFKKCSAFLIILCLIFSFTVCSPSPDKSKSPETQISNDVKNSEFDSYVNELFKETLSSDAFSIHSFLQHPENYGITDYEVTMGRYDIEDLDATKDITDAINDLKAFDRNTLSANQQITYDVLLKYFETELEYCDLYLFDTDLSTTIGLQVQLPLLYAEYSFNEEKDVKEYLTLISDTDEFFSSMIEYENLRSENGLFMEDYLADEIIEQCRTFVESSDDNILISTFNERLDTLTGISDEQKNSYIKQNETAVNDNVIKGYQLLIEGLESLKGNSKYSGGLCNYPNGNKYFEYLIKKDIGWSKSIDEYNELLDTYLNSSLMSMRQIIAKDSTVLDRFEAYSPKHTDPKEILSELREKIAADFPQGPSVNCDIKYVTKSLEDYASPAMYFTPQIDNLEKNSIYINSSSTNNEGLYSTLAHEGYPGHLYQITYFSNTRPDLIRHLLSFGGYTEGWATYCEAYSYSLESSDKNLSIIQKANLTSTLCLYAKIDIGVNYYNWTKENVASFLKNYGIEGDEVVTQIYNSMISEPGNYCKYVLGYIGFCELKNTAQNSLGNKFDIKGFHKYILDLGPVQFDILFGRLDEWIKSEMEK